LQRALQVSEPMIGKIRIQWWRETLEQLAGHISGKEGAPRRHDLAEELARVATDRSDLIAPMSELVDRFDDIIDDHLHAGGHEPGDAHAERHLAAEASLARLAGIALEPSVTASQLDALSRCGEAYPAALARLPDAGERWKAAQEASRRLPHALWPAIAHLAATRDPYRIANDPRTAAKAPLLKRWRVLLAMFSRRF
jgi:phytoene synthase